MLPFAMFIFFSQMSTLQFAMSTLQFALSTLQFAMSTLQFAISTLQFAIRKITLPTKSTFSRPSKFSRNVNLVGKFSRGRLNLVECKKCKKLVLTKFNRRVFLLQFDLIGVWSYRGCISELGRCGTSFLVLV